MMRIAIPFTSITVRIIRIAVRMMRSCVGMGGIAMPFVGIAMGMNGTALPLTGIVIRIVRITIRLNAPYIPLICIYIPFSGAAVRIRFIAVAFLATATLPITKYEKPTTMGMGVYTLKCSACVVATYRVAGYLLSGLVLPFVAAGQGTLGSRFTGGAKAGVIKNTCLILLSRC